MLALEIPEPDVKIFMSKLLKEDIFNHFEVRGIEISSFTRLEISGELDANYLNDDERTENKFCTWAELSKYVVDFIKDGKRPRLIKIVFSLSGALIHPNASACFLNMNYENNSVVFTTATAQVSFALDKSHDFAWDNYVREFFAKNNILVHEM